MDNQSVVKAVPARSDRNAFLLQWSGKLELLKAIKEEGAFVESLIQALADVLEMDVGMCLNIITSKDTDEPPSVEYEIAYLMDSNGKLAKEHKEIIEGAKFGPTYTPNYFTKTWDIKLNSINIPTPGFGPDFFLPLRTKAIMDAGTFASPLILLDDTSDEVDLAQVSGTIVSEIIKVRPLYDKVSSQTDGVI